MKQLDDINSHQEPGKKERLAHLLSNPLRGVALRVALVVGAPRAPKRPVGLHQLVRRHPGVNLEVVEVLGVDSAKDALLAQQRQKVVAERRKLGPRQNFLGHLVEGHRVLLEEFLVEQGLGLWEVQISDVGVQTCAYKNMKSTT